MYKIGKPNGCDICKLAETNQHFEFLRKDPYTDTILKLTPKNEKITVAVTTIYP